MIWKILRVTGWIVATLVALAVVLYGILVAINWRDREPSATARRFEAFHLNRLTVADNENAYIYAMGFEVIPGRSPEEMGSARVAWIGAQKATVVVDTSKDPLAENLIYRPQRPAQIQRFLDACKRASAECGAAFDISADTFKNWVADEGWLLMRYKELIARAGWREPVFDNTFPGYSLILQGQKFLLMSVRIAAAEGDTAGAKDLLQEDIQFWRRVLESSDSLLSRMIATRALDQHFEIGTIALKGLDLVRAESVVPEAWSITLSGTERSMSRSFVGEWMFFSRIIRNASSDPFWEDAPIADVLLFKLSMPLNQPQDSINKYARYYSDLTNLFDVPLKGYELVLDRANQLSEKVSQENWPPRSLYNLRGRFSMRIRLDYGDYAARVGDIEGVRRAALVVAALRQENVQPADVSRALTTLSLRNPYNDQPFAWDAKRSAVVFRGLEHGERREHLLYY